MSWSSYLTAGAPVRGASQVSLSPQLDPLATDEARFAAPAIDPESLSVERRPRAARIRRSGSSPATAGRFARCSVLVRPTAGRPSSRDSSASGTGSRTCRHCRSRKRSTGSSPPRRSGCDRERETGEALRHHPLVRPANPAPDAIDEDAAAADPPKATAAPLAKSKYKRCRALPRTKAASRRSFCHGSPGGYQCHEPCIPRCEWIVRPSSRCISRCLPRASTAANARPTSVPAGNNGSRARAASIAQPTKSGPQPCRRPKNRIAFGHPVPLQQRSMIRARPKCPQSHFPPRRSGGNRGLGSGRSAAYGPGPAGAGSSPASRGHGRGLLRRP